jgi:hypothetical protein
MKLQGRLNWPVRPEIVRFDMEEQTVTIPQERFEKLIRDSKWLQYLEAAGIDNSEAYEYACELAREDGFFDDED